MSLFGLGFPEMAVIGVIAVVIFGPKKLPELGSSIGKALRGFKEEMNTDSTETTDETADSTRSSSDIS